MLVSGTIVLWSWTVQDTAARHTQNTDTKLDEGQANETSAAELRGHVDDVTKHRVINDAGVSTIEMWSSSKIDGAPSITAGWDPKSGNFFVGTKSLFNKEPKINFTNDDIDRNHGHAAGLAKKLKLGLEHLPKIIKKGEIVAGDFMFDKDDLKSETIDGTKVISFQPNTITYAVDKTSSVAKRIQNAKIGVIFHSTYTGNDIPSMSVNFSISNNQFNTSPDVYFRTVNMTLDTIAWSTEQYSILKKDINELKTRLGKMDSKQINAIAEDPKLSQTIMTYINSKVRTGKRFNKNEIGNLIDYVASKFDKEHFKLKSEKGKAKKTAQKIEFIETLREYASTLYDLFQWSYAAEEIKNIFIEKLEEIEHPEMSYNLNPDGQYIKVGSEGFVVSDSPDSAIKMVNRAIFSRNNFNNVKFN